MQGNPDVGGEKESAEPRRGNYREDDLPEEGKSHRSPVFANASLAGRLTTIPSWGSGATEGGRYLSPILPRSLNLPVAVVDGSLTKNLNKTGVRLWTESPLIRSRAALWNRERK